jgi:hypothetical protein
MSENARRRVRTARDLLEIGSADAASMNSDQQLARPNVRHRHGLHSNVIDAPVNRRLHGGRNRMLRVCDRELSRDCHLN